MGLQKSNDKPNRPDWIAVYISHNLQEAHIIAGKLRANDIESMIQTVPGASAIGFTIGNWGEIKVLVAPSVYDEAYDILFPEDEGQSQENTDEAQYIWRDDGDGDEYYIDDEEA
jgi:hypothetical protein